MILFYLTLVVFDDILISDLANLEWSFLTEVDDAVGVLGSKSFKSSIS